MVWLSVIVTSAAHFNPAVTLVMRFMVACRLVARLGNSGWLQQSPPSIRSQTKAMNSSTSATRPAASDRTSAFRHDLQGIFRHWLLHLNRFVDRA
jgi:glycerol uptake facilitator-like aquaporin